MNGTIRRGLAVFALLACAQGWSAVHEVTISGLDFVPSELSIEVGDTVKWTWVTGIAHNVVADDSSFSSGSTTTEGNFQQTFNSVGEVPYHCQPHRNQGMTGVINVEDTAPEFFINAGLNDAWFNASTAGQGFFFTIFPENQLIFLAWFTFDSERPPESVEAILGDPGHRWFTALGAYEPGDSVSLEIELTEGLIFDSEEPPFTPDKQSYIGTMELTFAGCNDAVLGYDFPDQQKEGVIELTRAAPDEQNLALCEALNAEAKAAQ
jgi:plastocyanin